MRVLVVSAPLLGHAFPLVPLTRALRAAGHDVLVATGGDALAVRDAGLPVEDVAPGFRFGPIAARTLIRHPLVSRAELAGEAGTRGVGLLFGAVNARMAEPVAALADEWRPGLVVYEPLAVAGALAAARRRVPGVLHENSLWDGPGLVAVTARRLGRGYPIPAAVLTIAPPSVVGPRTGWPMRAVPYSGAGPVPDWLARPADRPRILVSRSTVGGPGAGDVMRAVVAVAGSVDAEIVLVRPDRAVDDRVGNVRAVDWVPLPAVLPTCAGIVHHGGAGTILAALAAGVPQLVVPGAGDRTQNARLVARRGAGLAVPARELRAADLTRLATDPALRAAAAEVSAEMAAMPAPEALAARLVELAG